MDLKCGKCNEVFLEGDARRVDEHDLPVYLACPYCGDSADIVECNVAWAAQENRNLAKELGELAEDPNLYAMVMAGEATFRKLLKVAAQNAGQVADFIEEL